MLRALRRWNESVALPGKDAANLDDAQIEAYLRRSYEARQPYHAWLSVWRHFSEWEGTFLDVGANVGQTITSFAIYNTRMRIWAFEPNPLCAEGLAFAAGLVPNEVTVLLCGPGDADADLPLYMPVVEAQKGFSPSSNASLRRSEFGKRHVIDRLLNGLPGADALSFLALPAVVRAPASLEEQPEDVRLIKIDVEGFERQVLDGLTPLIRRDRPVMTVERNNWPEIAEWMGREGYAAFDHDETGELRRVPEGPAGGSSVDPLLLPLDQLKEVMAKSTGLRLASPA
jgi:FkbM family methyltransferase